MKQAPKWFFILGAILLLWNLAGVAAYFMQMSMTPEMLAEKTLAEQQLYAATPLWSKAAFGLAVFAGAIGCVLLLMKKSLAYPVLILSLIGILAQQTYIFFLSDTHQVLGKNMSTVGMPIIVIVLGIFLFWLASFAKKEGWLKG